MQSLTNTPLNKEKVERLVFIPLTVEENQMSSNFKKLVDQDETTQHDALKEALQDYFVKHHMDLGGNPQRQLFSFTESLAPKIGHCGFANCGDGKPHIAVGEATFLQSGKRY